MFLDIIFIMILTFIVQYFLMSWIITNSYTDITNNLNKVYLSTIFSLFIAFIYILWYDFKQNLLSCNYYIGLGIASGVLIYAYRQQLGVTDYDWINSMIEIQSNGILVSKFMSEQKSSNENQTKCIELSKHIVNMQKDQIDLLKKLSYNSKIKGIFY
jgi:hypothetical protein